MKSATPPISDPQKKSHSRVLSRIAIGMAVLLLAAVGMVAWDLHNYPIPYSLYYDPFSSDSGPAPSPSLFNRPRLALGKFQSKLRRNRTERMRRERSEKIRLMRFNKIALPGSVWEAKAFVEQSMIFEGVGIFFKPDGALQFTSEKAKQLDHPIFKFNRYERVSLDTIVFMSETESYVIFFGIRSGDFRIREKDATIFDFISLEPVKL